MMIFLAGVSCVGKTAVGARLATRLELPFYDVDDEAERLFAMPVRRLYARFDSQAQWLAAMAEVVTVIIGHAGDLVCALPPIGLLGKMWETIKQKTDRIVIVLRDSPENILRRIVFFDVDSRPLERSLTPEQKALYLRAIRCDQLELRRCFRRADLAVDIDGGTIEDATDKVLTAIGDRRSGIENEHQTSGANHQAPRAL